MTLCLKPQKYQWMNRIKKGTGRKFLKESALYVPRLKRFVRNVLLNPTPLQRKWHGHPYLFLNQSFSPRAHKRLAFRPLSLPLRACKHDQVLIYITTLAASNGRTQSGASLNISWGNCPIRSEYSREPVTWQRRCKWYSTRTSERLFFKVLQERRDLGNMKLNIVGKETTGFTLLTLSGVHRNSCIG